jgi:hypothetical protein
MLVRNLEGKIEDVEGFEVNFLHPSGSDVKGHKDIGGDYGYDYKAKEGYTVSNWVENRFKKNFPGYDVEVLDGDGEPVPGNTKLETVRSSY